MIELDDIDTDDDGALTATATLPGDRRVTVEYQYDEDFETDSDDDSDDDDVDAEDIDPEDMPDLDTMQATVEHALARLTAEVLDGREEELTAELTEAAFEDEDAADLEEALAALRDDISLDGVVVFSDGGITLLYVAPSEYPDTTIFCLLDEDLDIDDVMIE